MTRIEVYDADGNHLDDAEGAVDEAGVIRLQVDRWLAAWADTIVSETLDETPDPEGPAFAWILERIREAGVTLDLSRLDAEAGRDGELYLYAGEAQALATAILNALAPQGA